MWGKAEVACVVAAGVLLCPPASGQSSSGAAKQDKRTQPARQAPLQKVATFDDLKARTADERVRAALWNFPGMGSLRDQGPLNIHQPHRRNVPPVPYPPGVIPPPPPTPEQRLRTRLCQTDLVFVGHAESHRVLANDLESWLFTDYTLTVARAIRPAATPRTILLSVPGGEAEVGGVRISTVTSIPLLQMKQSYVFSLQRIPGTDSFRTTEDFRAIDTAAATILSEAGDRRDPFEDYLRRLEAAALSCPGGRL